MKEAVEDTRFWDKLGICTSTLCLIHCIVPPVLMLFLPLNSAEIFDIEFVHDIFAVVVIGSVLIAIYPHFKSKQHQDIIGFASIGIILIVSAIFAHSFSEISHTILTMIGSAFLITSHVKNIKIRHGKCTNKSCQH